MLLLLLVLGWCSCELNYNGDILSQALAPVTGGCYYYSKWWLKLLANYVYISVGKNLGFSIVCWCDVMLSFFAFFLNDF